MRVEEFDPEKAWWAERKPTSCAWKVTADDVAASNYNLDIANPNVAEAGHEDPDILLARFAEAVAQLRIAQGALRASLAEALVRD